MCNIMIKLTIGFIKSKYKRMKLRYNIKKYDKRNQLSEYKSEVDYIKNHNVTMFPYDFIHKYSPKMYTAYFDEVKTMYYVLHENKRLYFPKDKNKDEVLFQYRCLLVEQDKESPHRYFQENINQFHNSVFVDCGAAEGLLTLMVIEQVSKAYIIECEEMWEEPLKATFAPWKEKVVFVKKFLSNKDSDTCCRLDTLLRDEIQKIIIKMDIEGEEINALHGGADILNNCKNDILLSVCSYHNQNDYCEIEKFLSEIGYRCSPSNGWMLWYFNIDLEYPFFRRGVVHAVKNLAGHCEGIKDNTK